MRSPFPQHTYVSIEMATDLNVKSVYNKLYSVRPHIHFADSKQAAVNTWGRRRGRTMQKNAPESTLQKSAAWELPKPEAVSLYLVALNKLFPMNFPGAFVEFSDVLSGVPHHW